MSGSPAENEAQAEMAQRLGADGLEVDHWRIGLDELTADPDFPAMEVDRAEATYEILVTARTLALLALDICGVADRRYGAAS